MAFALFSRTTSKVIYGMSGLLTATALLWSISCSGGRIADEGEDFPPGSKPGDDDEVDDDDDSGSDASDDDDDDNDDADDDDDDSDDPGDDTDPTKPHFDLADTPDIGNPDQELEFSYIWIANSPECTVSKIDTRTLKEIGRYKTGPEGACDPSRTSVNLDGDVGVVNREGGVSKIMAVSTHCTDRNGDMKVTTSTGPLDVLPWGQDDCVVWNKRLNAASRPAAWTLGTPVTDPKTGKTKFIDPKLWVSAPAANKEGRVDVFLLNGETGETEKSVGIDDIATSEYGLYGGAVDSKSDFWGIPLATALHDGTAKLVHVPFADPSKFEVIPIPFNQGYGTTVDHKDRPWVGCDSAAENGGVLQRYDPKAKEWKRVDLSSVPGSDRFWIRGMMVDANDDLWAAVVRTPEETGPGGGILRVNTETVTLVDYIGPDTFNSPQIRQPTGTSIDVDGKVWLVDQQAMNGGVYVLDPVTYQIDFVGGLNAPYTYSDMTGFALRGVLPQGYKH